MPHRLKPPHGDTQCTHADSGPPPARGGNGNHGCRQASVPAFRNGILLSGRVRAILHLHVAHTRMAPQAYNGRRHTWMPRNLGHLRPAEPAGSKKTENYKTTQRVAIATAAIGPAAFPKVTRAIAGQEGA